MQLGYATGFIVVKAQKAEVTLKVYYHQCTQLGGIFNLHIIIPIGDSAPVSSLRILYFLTVYLMVNGSSHLPDS